jgi:hypothetical protein
MGQGVAYHLGMEDFQYRIPAFLKLTLEKKNSLLMTIGINLLIENSISMLVRIGYI